MWLLPALGLQTDDHAGSEQSVRHRTEIVSRSTCKTGLNITINDAIFFSHISEYQTGAGGAFSNMFTESTKKKQELGKQLILGNNSVLHNKTDSIATVLLNTPK